MKIQNKTKAALAGGLAVAILAGGAGTMARWYDTEQLTDRSIQSGELSMEAGEGVWTDELGHTVDPETFLAVPGDTLTFTRDVVINAKGDHLDATLSADLTSALKVDEGAADPDDVADLLRVFQENGTFEVTGGGTLIEGTDTYNITEADDGATLQAVVTLTFPEYMDEDAADPSDTAPFEERAGWWGDNAQLEGVSLEDVQLDLTQDAAPHDGNDH